MKPLLFSCLLCVGCCCFLGGLYGQNPLFIPDTLTGTNFNLSIDENTKEFYAGYWTSTIGINSNYLAPTLIFNQGETVSMNVTNNLIDTTTIHWHGLHVPPEDDGGPHTVVLPGTTWNPSFTITNKAATYWYHSHLHMKVSEQITRGEAGFLIVRDTEESALNLPRRYGIDDFPLMIQSRAFDVSKQFIVDTAADDVILVNGIVNPYLPVPAQIVRLRLLNASSERTYYFGVQGNLTFYQIASDGGLLAAPVPLTRVMLSPGERAEMLLDLNGMTGQNIYLMSFCSELPSGIYGAADPSAFGADTIPGYTNNPLNGGDFNILLLTVVPPTINPVINIPSSLTILDSIPSSSANLSRILRFFCSDGTHLEGPFYINGQTFDMGVINYTIPLNNVEIWELRNQTAIAHPFHIHGVQFFVLDIDGNPPPLNLQGYKDVICVLPQQIVRIIMKFEDFSHPVIPYMYHCHMLMHEDEGMMGQFLVVDNTSVEDEFFTDVKVMAYPNPIATSLNLRISNFTKMRNTNLIFSLYDVLGRKVLQSEIMNKQSEIQRNDLPNGIYFYQLKNKNGIIGKGKIIFN